ncbi:DNA polymerase III subunit delta' [soil metagenome]
MSASVANDWRIAGHETAVEQLHRAVSSGNVRHALLISGPEGVGKATIAKALLKALSCLNPPVPGDFCGECRSCRKIERGVHPDLQRFDLASQAATAEKSGSKNTSITIETARDIRSAAVMRPIEGRWRAVVLDDAESMQEVAQEALLKTLEEPPPSMLLILLTNDLDALLPTIQSRCQVIELQPVPSRMIESMLVARGASEDQASDLAQLAQGLPGWAIRALEEPKVAAVRLNDVEQAIGWIGANAYERLVQAVRRADLFAKSRIDTLAQLGVLLSVWRDAMLLNTGLTDRVTYRVLADRLAELSARWTLTDLHRALRSVQVCIRDLETNVRPRLAMESMVLQWPKT